MNKEINPSKLESQTGGETPQDIETRKASCWKISEKHELKVLRFVAFGLAISLLILIVGYNLKPSIYHRSISGEYITASHFPEENKCLTSGCVISAANIIDRIDSSVDPCEDFYSYACGNFIKKVVLPDDKSFVTSISATNDILSLKVRFLVEEELKNSDPPSTKLVKNLYKSCMNTDLIQRKGLEPLKSIIKSLGGWPVVEGETWDESQFDWVELVYKMRELGYPEVNLLSFGITTDMKNSSWRIIEIEQAKLGMPSREYYMKGFHDNDIQAYLEYQVRLAVLLGADPERAKQEFEDVVKFEMEIANYTLPEELRRNIELLYNKITLRDLAIQVPNIPWLNLTNNILEGIVDLVTEDEPVVVSVPLYLINLSNLLKKTPKRVLGNYMIKHVVATSVSYLSQEIRAAELQYSKKLFGIGKEAPRWKECMDMVSEELTYAVGSLYVRHFFNEDAKAKAEEMVYYIRKAFDGNLETIDWMDEKTKARAIKKAKSIKSLIGYPKEIMDEDVLNEYHKGLVISEGQLLSNMVNITKFKRNYVVSHLRKRVIKADWKIYGGAAIVNAFYSSMDNAILFPAGILQGVFFDAERPKYLNYGAIGLVIGHEITHGFDDEGSQFNEFGDLENWWDLETRKEFLNRSQCIIEQYSKFLVPEVHLYLNGIITQGENIADNGGIKEAYRAYEMWLKDNKLEEPSLPGLNLTSRQLFWVSSAHLWCSKERHEHLKMSVLSKSHSPPRYRINGPMKNLPEFSRDWNCPLNSPMNPPNKCRVW